MWADYPQTLLYNQALRINSTAGLALGTELVSYLVYESKGEQWRSVELIGWRYPVEISEVGDILIHL